VVSPYPVLQELVFIKAADHMDSALYGISMTMGRLDSY
jgi:hypothetical protein